MPKSKSIYHDVSILVAVVNLVVNSLKMSTRIIGIVVIATVVVVIVVVIVAVVVVRCWGMVHRLHDTLGYCVCKATACRRTEMYPGVSL